MVELACSIRGLLANLFLRSGLGVFCCVVGFVGLVDGEVVVNWIMGLAIVS